MILTIINKSDTLYRNNKQICSTHINPEIWSGSLYRATANCSTMSEIIIRHTGILKIIYFKYSSFYYNIYCKDLDPVCNWST